MGNKEFDVDAVVLWVDGNDPEWQREKQKYKPQTDSPGSEENRFRDWGMMVYWFRAIEKYAPWIRKVHFVTWGHLPEFLNPDCEKLHIVNHKDYLPENVLPLFNSNALEMNIHRIPGLAEHFLYFNDDMFLTSPIKKEDYFDLKSGLPRLPVVEMPLRMKGVCKGWQITGASNIGIINDHIKKRSLSIRQYPGSFISFRYPFEQNLRNIVAKLIYPEYYIGFKNYHGVAAFTKTAFQEVWEAEPYALEKTTSHRFREIDDVNQWLILWWQIASGKFKAKINKHFYYEARKDTRDEICRHILKQDCESICINDPDSGSQEEIRRSMNQILHAFHETFTEKSIFEK